MSKRFKEFNYEITFDTDFMDKQYCITPTLKRELNTLYFEIQEGKKNIIEKLLKLIEQHPNNPQLKNFLSIAYKNIGKISKSYEVNRWIVKEHPNYLFGKLNIAAEHIEKKEYNKVPELLGNLLDIQEIYPERKIFHVGEVLSFNKLAIHYFLCTNNFDAAASRLDIMDKLAPDHPDTISIRKVLSSYLFDKDLIEYHKSMEGSIETMANSKISRKQTKRKPTFANKEIEFLYQRGLRIDPLLLEIVLKLPRKSLIEDLEKVLVDSIERYNYFKNLDDKEEYSEETFTFPIHALFLLGELRSENSLPLVLEVFSQSEDFLEFWFGSHITESLPEIVMHLAKNQLDSLKDFIKQPCKYKWVRTAISSTVSQIVFHEPNRKMEIVEWYENVFNFFLNTKIDENIIDSEVISLMITDIVEIRLKELAPLVKKLFEKEGYVIEDISESLEIVLADLNSPFNETFKRPLMNIYSRYQEIITTWGGYTEDDFEDDDDDFPERIEQIFNPLKDVGRNDPCPCGSGKKFKKCCANN
jgi:hypothetical protein